MSEDVNELIDGATGGSPEGGAADSIISPELLAEVRASGTGKKPPTATRLPEPDTTGAPDRTGAPASGDDHDEELEEPSRRGRSRYARYRKHEVEAEAERLSQRVDELEAAQREQAQRDAAPSETVLRDLAFTIEFATRIGFGSAALIRGPHWKIQDEEVERIKETGVIALGPMAQEYANALPWLNLAAALGVPISMRIAEDRRISKLREIPPDAI